MNAALARYVDHFFMRLMLRFRDEEARLPADAAERYGQRLNLFRRLRPPDDVFPNDLARALHLERTERFSGTLVRFDSEMPGLPLPLPYSHPPVYHFYPVRKEPKAALVLLHGWRQPVLGAVGRFARYASAHGIASVVLELPGHITRRVSGRTPGEGFASLDPEVLLPHLFHAVAEAEAARRLLKRAFGDIPAGVLGVSLGGWLAALTAMIFEPDFVYLISPAVAPARIFQRSPLFERRRREAARSPWGIDGFVEALKMVSPMTSDPLVPGHSIGVMSGRYDQVIAFEDVVEFARHWETRTITEMSHGHFSLVYFNPGLFEQVLAELQALIGDLPARWKA